MNSYFKKPIIRLKGEALKQLKFAVIERDQACIRCGANHNLSVHHIVFYSQGGEDILSNCITLCVDCHAGCHQLAHIKCYGTADNLQFSLTVDGALAVKNGKLRAGLINEEAGK